MNHHTHIVHGIELIIQRKGNSVVTFLVSLVIGKEWIIAHGRRFQGPITAVSSLHNKPPMPAKYLLPKLFDPPLQLLQRLPFLRSHDRPHLSDLRMYPPRVDCLGTRR